MEEICHKLIKEDGASQLLHSQNIERNSDDMSVSGLYTIQYNQQNFRYKQVG